MIRLFRVFVPVGALALLFSEILLTASCFLVVTFLILNVDPQVFLFNDSGLQRIAVVVASILFGLFFEDLYERIHVKSRVLLLQQLSLVLGIALLIQGIIGYVSDGFRLPVRLMLPAGVLTIVALFAWRIVYSAVVLRVVGPQRILFVGKSPLLEEMAGHMAAHPELGLETIGYVDGVVPAAPPVQSGVLGPLSSLLAIAAAVKPDRIVVGFAERRQQMPIAGLLQLRYSGTVVEEASVAYEQLCGRVLLKQLRPAQIVFSSAFRPRPEQLIYQTLGNWLLALLLGIFTAPLLLFAAILLKVSSRGPLLSRKECAGLGARPFTLYRLRLPRAGEAGINGAQKFVRRWRLDALPHLWNILRGEMCFVGPRAERPEFVDALTEAIPFYRQRCRVRPGITGWAQINMPPDEPEDTLRRLEYDFYYLKNFSRGLDTYILVHTLKELLISRTAARAWHTNS
jgi:lipopolysaccharide/colanic/teichoic acid biosynthesis glycosyltransferase